MNDKSTTSADARTMRARMLAGDLYIAGDPQLAAEGMRAARLTHQFNTGAPDHPNTWAALRELLGSFGAGAFVKPPLWCDYGYQLTGGSAAG